MAQNVLVVEDETDIRNLVVFHLAREGYRCRTAATGTQALQEVRGQLPDLIVLDLMLPETDGLEVCRRVRADPVSAAVPIIMLTAKADEVDRVVGLEMGADDYLVKPFVARELLARIKAILRRTRMLPPNLQITEPGRLVAFGDWTLDTTARHLVDPQGTIVSLSGAEYRLLRVFLDHPQRVLNRDQLLNLTQGRDADVFGRSIDLLVSRVRQRLRDDAREPLLIKTVRSEGYVFSAPVRIVEG
jgi:DNA-binding response OmpR family regulator